ncbi:MAG TPA: hypothetical protein VKB89_30450 [Xanthobacteraceae bacterium]|nr:hypothetical protein [Xanthobacteraceae bacterium]
MKLNSAQLERTLGQFEARAIPDDNPVIPQLKDLFGDHTFLLDSHGLNIVEPIEATGAAGQSAKVVNIASWTDDSRSGLELHEPETTDTVITLASKH